MRLMQMTTFYPAYLADFYRRHAGLSKESCDAQTAALLADGFSAGHMTSSYMGDLGYEVALVVANCQEIQGAWAREHDRRLASTPAELFATALARIDDFKPDILYLQDPILYDSRFLAALANRPRLVVGWRAAPIPKETDWSNFDLVLSSDEGYRNLALQHGAHAAVPFMPGFPRQIAERVAATPKSADVSFCGQITGEHMDRIEGLSALAQHAHKAGYTTGFHLGIRPHLQLPQALKDSDRGAVWGMEMYRAVRAGKIAPNFHINAAVTRAQNMRLLEVTGVGTFMLNEYDPHLEQHFAIGREVETFRDIPELFEKVRYYLDHDKEREEIARRGQARCLADHSMERRGAWLNEIFREYLNKPRAKATEWKVRPAAVDLVHAETLLNQGRIAEAAEALNRIVQKNPTNPGALHLLGRVAAAAGQTQRAAELFAAAKNAGYVENQVATPEPPRQTPPSMDTRQFKILTLEENPERHEQIIVAQQSDPSPAAQKLLTSTYLEKDRAGAYERFRTGLEFRKVCGLLDTFGVKRDAAICEIGGGSGFFSWALSRAGYANVALMEPNGQYNTGTGYLRSRNDVKALRIHNDLKTWHASADTYDVIVTKNCIHHFQNIAQAAAAIRQKMKPGARWFAFREQFADTPRELYGLFETHPYAQPYGLYEWSYPASHYVEAIEIAGFSLTGVVPSGYANNAMAVYQEDPGGQDAQDLTAQIDSLLAKSPQATVQAFWDEVLRNRFQQGTARFFTRPQLMVFDVKAI